MTRANRDVSGHAQNGLSRWASFDVLSLDIGSMDVGHLFFRPYAFLFQLLTQTIRNSNCYENKEKSKGSNLVLAINNTLWIRGMHNDKHNNGIYVGRLGFIFRYPR